MSGHRGRLMPVHLRASRSAGFMYVEVLVSLVLLAFGLLSIGPMLVLASHENAAARDQTIATSVAQDRSEALKRLPYGALAGGADEVVMGAIRYERTWTVDDDTPHPGMRTVTVTVTPQRAKAHGGAREVIVSFYRVPS